MAIREAVHRLAVRVLGLQREEALLLRVQELEGQACHLREAVNNRDSRIGILRMSDEAFRRTADNQVVEINRLRASVVQLETLVGKRDAEVTRLRAIIANAAGEIGTIRGWFGESLAVLEATEATLAGDVKPSQQQAQE